mmetsp:Transcript_32834/g.79461  ORF Transcript_32834/g.79461 Transcript_32834/m.79461 type:complete len:273 (+) Transcript_32834:1669-2487(+)
MVAPSGEDSTAATMAKAESIPPQSSWVPLTPSPNEETTHIFANSAGISYSNVAMSSNILRAGSDALAPFNRLAAHASKTARYASRGTGRSGEEYFLCSVFSFRVADFQCPREDFCITSESTVLKSKSGSDSSQNVTPSVAQSSSISAAVALGASATACSLLSPKCSSSLPLKAAVVPIADKPRDLHSRCSARKASLLTSAYDMLLLPLVEAIASSTSLIVAETFMVEPILGFAASWKLQTDEPLAAARTRTHALDRRITKKYFLCRRLNCGR